jgi:hypothetical protein
MAMSGSERLTVSTWLSGFDPSTGNGTFKLTSGRLDSYSLFNWFSRHIQGEQDHNTGSDDTGTNIQSWDNSATDGISLRSSNGTTRLFCKKENGNVGIGVVIQRKAAVYEGGLTAANLC